MRAHLRLLLLSLALTAAVEAAPKIGGNYRYQFDPSGRQVTIGIERLFNTDAQNATGNLMVKLWATHEPYNGGTLNGHVIASFPLEGLAGGRQYSNLSKTVAYQAPGTAGTYYLCLTVSEYRNGGFSIVSWGNMPQPKALGPVRLFTLEGPWTWKSSYPGGTVDFSFGKITHTRSGDSGSLRLELWASPAPWHGGPMPGAYRIASIDKPALHRGNMYANQTHTAKFTPPPDGHYYVSLLLSEFNQGYKVVAFIPGERPVLFQRP